MTLSQLPSNLTDYLSHSWDSTQSFISFPTTLEVLKRTHLFGAGSGPTNQPDIASGEPTSPQEHVSIPRDALEIISIQLRLNTLMSSQIPTPGKVQSNKKHHAQWAPLRDSSITSPRLCVVVVVCCCCCVLLLLLLCVVCCVLCLLLLCVVVCVLFLTTL